MHERPPWEVWHAVYTVASFSHIILTKYCVTLPPSARMAHFKLDVWSMVQQTTLPTCRRLLFPSRATNEIGDVCTQSNNVVVGVVDCVPRPCLRNDTWLSNTTCKDETLCCGVEEVGHVTVSCGSSVTFSVSRVRPISSKTSTKITGSLKRSLSAPAATDYNYEYGKRTKRIKAENAAEWRNVFKNST